MRMAVVPPKRGYRLKQEEGEWKIFFPHHGDQAEWGKFPEKWGITSASGKEEVKAVCTFRFPGLKEVKP